MKPVLVLTTVGSDFDAGALARSLVEQRLIACASIVDRVRSIYRWEGAVTEAGETLLIFKTTNERVAELRVELEKLHPYEVPEFVVVPVAETSEAYGAWILESVAR
jgi:periplasmic divalent cation tolerance protein